MAKPREIPGIGAGLNLDALPDDLPPGMWSDARNMRFKNGEARSFGGIQKVFGDLPGAAEPRYIAAYQTTDDKRYFIVVAGGRVYALGGALPGPADITPTGDLQASWAHIVRMYEPGSLRYTGGGGFQIGGSSTTTTTDPLRVVATYTGKTQLQIGFYNNGTIPDFEPGILVGDKPSTNGFTPDVFNLNGTRFTVTAIQRGLTEENPRRDYIIYTLEADSVATDPYITDAVWPKTQATVIGQISGYGTRPMSIEGEPDSFSSCAFGGLFVFSAANIVPCYWNGTEKLKTLPTWPPNKRAKFIVSFKSYLVAFLPNRIFWSASAVAGTLPSTWSEVDLTKDAGSLDLADTSDLIIDAEQLGNQLVIYKQKCSFTMELIGEPFIFRVARVPSASGMLSRRCCAITPHGHVVLSSGDVVVNNGYGAKSIADGRVRKYLFNNISPEETDSCFVAINPPMNEVLVCYRDQSSTPTLPRTIAPVYPPAATTPLEVTISIERGTGDNALELVHERITCTFNRPITSFPAEAIRCFDADTLMDEIGWTIEAPIDIFNKAVWIANLRPPRATAATAIERVIVVYLHNLQAPGRLAEDGPLGFGRRVSARFKISPDKQRNIVVKVDRRNRGIFLTYRGGADIAFPAPGENVTYVNAGLPEVRPANAILAPNMVDSVPGGWAWLMLVEKGHDYSKHQRSGAGAYPASSESWALEQVNTVYIENSMHDQRSRFALDVLGRAIDFTQNSYAVGYTATTPAYYRYITRTSDLIPAPLAVNRTTMYCNRALVWNWTDDTWALRDLPNVLAACNGLLMAPHESGTWETDTQAWRLDSTAWNEDEYSKHEDRLVLCGQGGISLFDIGNSDDSIDPIDTMLERRGITFAGRGGGTEVDGSGVKLLRRVLPRIEAPPQVTVLVQAGESMQANKRPYWHEPVPFDTETDAQADTIAQGRYLSLRLTCKDTWRIRGLAVDVVPTGSQ